MVACHVDVCPIDDLAFGITKSVPNLAMSANSEAPEPTEGPLPLFFSISAPPPSICAAAVANPHKKSFLNGLDMVDECSGGAKSRMHLVAVPAKSAPNLPTISRPQNIHKFTEKLPFPH